MAALPLKTPHHPLATLVFWLVSLAPFIAAQQLPLKSYTTGDGLAHNNVHRIVKDSRGFLWFCTSDGLARFDGYDFTNYSMEQGLPHRTVTDFVETRAGEFWVATYGGLARFNPLGAPVNRVVEAHEAAAATAMFSVVWPGDADRNARAVEVLLESRDGTLWCGTRQHLYRMERRGGRFALAAIDDGLGTAPWHAHIQDLLEDRQGSLWIGVMSLGLFRRWPDGRLRQYDYRDGLPYSDFFGPPQTDINDLFEDRQGRLWAGTRTSGFFRFNAEAGAEAKAAPFVAARYGRADGYPSDWVFRFYETADSRFWIASNEGLVEFFPEGDGQSRRFRPYTQRNGLSFREVTALAEDAGGNLWLGTNNAGAMRLARNGFVSYGAREGLLAANAIFADAAGGICIRANVLGDQRPYAFDGAQADLRRVAAENSTQRFGRFDGERFAWFAPGVPFNFGFDPEQIAVQTSNGEWWIGSGAGVYRFPAADNFARIRTAQPLAVYTPKHGLPSLQSGRIFADSEDNVWLSGFGLSLWEHVTQRWRNLENTPGLPSLKSAGPSSFAEDRTGNIWLGFNGGLARYRAGQFTFFTTNDGFPAGAILNMHIDRAGRLWLASSRSGLLRLDDPAAERPVFRTYATAQGLSSNSTRALTEDRYGRIYVATARGLDQLEPATDRFRHFTTDDGLAPGNIQAAYCDRQGSIWIGTHRGLSRFVPAPPETALPPPILITGLNVAGARRAVSVRGETEIALADLAPDRNQLQIEFVGLGFAPGEVLRYQYQLTEADAAWNELAAQRTVNFASLAPGRYRFRVRAVNADGVVSAQPATVSFTVLRPVWQRWWFLASVLALLGLLAMALYRYRVARLLELERMRTRIATDLHDDIGAGLSRVAILSEVVKRQVAGSGEQSLPLLNEIADSARSLVESMREIVWAIDPRRDELGSLISRVRQFASDVLDAQGINWDFDAPDELEQLKLDPEQRRQLFLIFKEAINNIARHSRCQSASLSLKLIHQQLCGEIRDDGRGFAHSPEMNSANGHGLENMKRRAAQLGGEVRIDSSPGGANIKLMIPLKNR